ncbi:putative ubiquitin-like-specific protease 1B [Apium graveolens]|uniref:putative ubiquitin-like-specific protease 1B n=1 Tax=Apium graveolens TaxID=4045 RepID=UPI003D7A4ADB
MFLSKKQVQILAPGNELEDDIVNAYMELVRLRERWIHTRRHERSLLNRLTSFRPTIGNFKGQISSYVIMLYFLHALEEKVLPCWLNYLDPQRFTKKFMKMAIVTARPKQDTGCDCGVYVCKYVDVILNGIRLEHAIWHPYDDVETFRYRITWELRRGRARHLSAWGLTQRNLGL